MASQVPPVNASEFIFYWALVSRADANILQVNPTLAAGDVTVSVDGVDFGNIDTLPVVLPAGGVAIKVVVSAAEMTGDNTNILFHDVAGAEWADTMINAQSVARLFNKLAFSGAENAIDVTSGGAVGLDWGNIENKTTANLLTGTTVASVDADTAIIPDTTPADGTRPTPQQAWLMVTRFLQERSVSGLTMTVKKEDGSTAVMTFTLNDATNPTSITRAT